MSSPPYFDDFSAAGSQARPEHPGAVDSDHKFKRRRLGVGASPNITSQGNPPQARSYHPNSYPGHGSSHFQSSINPTNMAPHVPSLWPEDEALDYLASSNGFTQDLGRYIPAPRFYPQHLPSSASQHLRPPILATDVPPRLVVRPSIPDGVRQGMRDPLRGNHVRNMPNDTPTNERLAENFVSQMMDQVGGSPPRPHFTGRDSMFTPTFSVSTAPRRRSTTSTSVSSKDTIIVTLSRATQEKINALQEHKRDCPICSLDFEPDHYMAVMSCCGTAMHASCLSAHVNSELYPKNKACMNCRRKIDARRSLNHVIPPVDTANWDQGVDMNAPSSLTADDKVDVDVSERPERDRIRRARGSAYGIGFNNPFSSIPRLPNDVNPEIKDRVMRMAREQREEMSTLQGRVDAYSLAWRAASEADKLAYRARSEAYANIGEGPNNADLEGLTRACAETTEASRKAQEQFILAQKELEKLQRMHTSRLHMLIEEAFMEEYRERVANRPAIQRPTSSGSSIPPPTN